MEAQLFVWSGAAGRGSSGLDGQAGKLQGRPAGVSAPCEVRERRGAGQIQQDDGRSVGCMKRRGFEPIYEFGPPREVDQLCINTIRTLSMDAVQKAHSGHPGAPMALAPVVYCLWQRFLRFDPEHPIWPNRDRFVLSIGHASMLLYSMLHLTRVKAVNPQYETLGQASVELDDLKKFRQLDSKCPGHPEYRWTSGV